MPSTFSDYGAQPSGSPSPGPSVSNGDEYLSLGKLKRQYTDYLDNKRPEIDEQIQARRYRHGAQYTEEQLKVFRQRKQPAVTYNRIARKIDGIVGLVERMRADVKAFPRTPKQQDGADLATAVTRYALDTADWKELSPVSAGDGATDGYGGVEVIIEEGDQGDREVSLVEVDPDSFFYDPRSFKADFSDARYMGSGKWMDVEAAKDLFPDKAEEIQATLSEGSDLVSNSDRDMRWFQADQKRVRIVEHWYIHKGKWCYCIYTGAFKIAEGESYLKDEKRKTACKYIMFSAMVDQDGDRYGFIRNMKSAQDEINARRSKGLHELNTRRIIGEVGAFDDVEEARREGARPDGVVLRNRGFEAEFDDAAKMANIEGQFKFLEDARAEIENFGPNPALIGQGIENQSGRAINLLQQAGMAELGPFILAYRGWKLRVYKAVFNAIQNHWTAERYVRVTDDEGLAQFIQINGIGIDPNTGMPSVVNALGSLDVDIILDEGPDTMNVMQDTYEFLLGAQQQGQQVPLDLFIEVMPLDGRTKKKWLEKLQQPNPAEQVAIQGEAAKVEQTQADTRLKDAQRVKTLVDAQVAQQPEPMQMDAGPTPVEQMKTMADARAADAQAELRHAQTAKTIQDIQLAPQQMAQDHQLAMKKASQSARPAA